jgi:hypothetical protein
MLVNFFSDYGYFAVFGVSDSYAGFGLPVPEDISLSRRVASYLPLGIQTSISCSGWEFVACGVDVE